MIYCEEMRVRRGKVMVMGFEGAGRMLFLMGDRHVATAVSWGLLLVCPSLRVVYARGYFVLDDMEWDCQRDRRDATNWLPWN